MTSAPVLSTPARRCAAPPARPRRYTAADVPRDLRDARRATSSRTTATRTSCASPTARRPAGRSATRTGPAARARARRPTTTSSPNPPQGPTTGAQVHATCDVPALTTRPGDPQLAGHGSVLRLRPVPAHGGRLRRRARRLARRREDGDRRGPDAVADTDAAREAACEALPGATRPPTPADATQSAKAAWASGRSRRRRQPLSASIATLNTSMGSLTSDLAAKTAELTGVKGDAQQRQRGDRVAEGGTDAPEADVARPPRRRWTRSRRTASRSSSPGRRARPRTCGCSSPPTSSRSSG